VLAWVPPGGDLAERRYPSVQLRRIWADAARARLSDALDAAWGGVPPDLVITPVIIRGDPGPSLVQFVGSGTDLLVVGAGRRGALRRLRHGAASRYCVSRACCPVWAVPALAPGTWASARRDGRCDGAN
jgi:nucleotide-binding universal stress UspA family protein